MGRLMDELMESDHICIYGCGECGIQIYLLLKEAGINISCFGDRDCSKAGYIVGGLFCRTYSDILLADKKELLLIVAIAQGEKTADAFRNIGFEKVLYYEDIKRELTADIIKEYRDTKSLGINTLRELKQCIEELVYEKDLSIERKRDAVFQCILNIQEDENNETFAG